MPVRSASLPTILLTLALSPTLACIQGPPIDSEEHPGRGGTDCFFGGCHDRGELPALHDQGWRPPDCVGCHGANGVCAPITDAYAHQSDDDCAGCHVERHGYTRTPDCIRCHYAETGTIDCAD